MILFQLVIYYSTLNKIDCKNQSINEVPIRSQGEVEILSGLKPGDRIVLSGQFLIDSEANRQVFLRFSEAGQQQSSAYQH